MKSIVLTLLFFVLSLSSFAQIQIDTVLSVPAGPGVWHRKLVAPTIPWTFNVLQIDLRNSYLTMETAKANDRLAGYERTSAMAARNSYPGHAVIGAVNGDFYGGSGVPISIQVRKGEVLRGASGQSTIGFSATNAPMLRIISLSSVVRRAGAAATISGYNQTRNTNQLVLYNSYMGTTTGTNAFGAEAIIRPVGEWLVNDTVACIVDTIVNGVGNITIPQGKAVLSGHGTSQTFLLSNIHKGDTVKVFQGIAPGLRRLRELIGGFPKIVFNGSNYVDQGFQEEGGPSHTYERHPRTAAGFSADSSMLYLITVDGRQTTSAGMTLHELANFMIGLGVHHGINFDGGGSTTMVVRGVVENSPSDGGGERTVSNALMVVSSAPTDTLARLLLNPKRYRVYRGETFSYFTHGIDRFGNPVGLVSGLLQYSVPSRLGVIDSSGRFTAALVPDSGFVRVRYRQFTDSAFVVIKSISRIILAPQTVVTDTSRTIQFNPKAYDWDGVEKTIPLQWYTWLCTNSAVGTVDTVGIFRGRAGGAARIVAGYLGVSDTADVAVQLGSGTALLDSMESLQRWTFSGVNIDTINSRLTIQNGISTIGLNSLKVNYRFVYDPAMQNFARLNTDIPVYGVPDSLTIDVRTDSSNHRVIFWVEDDNNEPFRFYTNRFVLPSAQFDRLTAATATPVGSGTFHYPIRVKRIEFQLGSGRVSGATYNGLIYIDNLRVKYPSGVSFIVPVDPVPTRFALEQNYPNPFNPSTRIRFSLASAGFTTLRLYNILGQEVTTLVAENLLAGTYEVELRAAGISSGTYFYRLVAGNSTATRKLLILK